MGIVVAGFVRCNAPRLRKHSPLDSGSYCHFFGNPELAEKSGWDGKAWPAYYWASLALFLAVGFCQVCVPFSPVITMIKQKLTSVLKSQLVHLVPHGPAHCPQSKAASGSTGANRRAARSDTNRAPETREESCQGTATATDAPRLATSESGGHHGSSDRVGIKRLRAGKTTNVDWALFGTGLGNRLADTVLLVTGTALYSNWSLVTD
jgi:hypothetical protein